MYNHQKIEKKWAEKWVKDKTFTPDLEKAKNPYYALFMFPYPSAEGLHIGNFYAFTCVDVMAKYEKLKRKDVFEPIGFDAFGIHSENYALKIGETPKKMLNRTTANFKKQLSSAGLGCDWTREVNTTDPEYYKWTQWIFTKLFEKGLAYQKEALLNWCPGCKTVLADEQIENGVCERCKAIPEKKTMKQWFLKITAYSQRLLDELDDMDWSDITKHAQRNWIGRSEGAIVQFSIFNFQFSINVFTTRPDTLFGATYMVLSPEHELVKKITSPEQKKEVEKYIKKTGAKSDLERTEAKGKTGVFTGAYAINPVNNEKIPIWIADYVLMGYGTGAIMAVPAHDERDFEFAEKYGLPIRQVVKETADGRRQTADKNKKIIFTGDGVNINSDFPAEILGNTKTPEKNSEVLGGPEDCYHRCGSGVCHSINSTCDNQNNVKNQIIGIGALLETKHGIFLFQKRDLKTNRNTGMIAPFGGGINKNETAIDALKREIKEELSFDISGKQIKSIGFFESHIERNKFIEIFYIKDIPDDKLKIKEGEKIVKLKLNEALQNKKVTDFTKEVIKYFQKTKNITKTLNGLTTKQAKKEIIKWLEKNGLGKGTVNYKLRDWCISRQRYWGPPVPIVYCKKCAENEKENALILHGWEDSSKTGFIPSLKENLISKNYSTFAFDAPNTNKPDFDTWYKFIESKIKKNNLNKNLTLVGHSMGSLIALKLAEKYKFNKLILVAPVGLKPSKKYFEQFKNDLTKEEMEIFVNYQNRNLDIKKIKENTKEIIFVFGKKDKWITEEIRNFYIKNFKNTAKIHILENQGHMSEDEGVKKVEFIENLFNKLTPGVYSVPEKDLPVELPEMKKGWEPAGDGRGPLAKVNKFMKAICPKCKGPAEREPDVMDNFLDSAWYYYRYLSPHDDGQPFNKLMAKKWLPVDLYVGGNEHAVLHLMYTRFITMAFHDLGLINFDNPFKKFRANGMILKDNKKMSKSKGNVVNPEEYGAKVGYDALKTYLLFLGPLSEDRSFSDAGVQGAKRWMERIDRLQEKIKNNYKDNEELIKKLHKTIKTVTDDFEEQKYNTAVARLMELTNSLSAEKNISSQTWEKFLIIIAPFAPALAEELWVKSGNKQSIFKASWPKHDPKLIKDDTINLVVQINGKLRDTIEARINISEKEAQKIALESEKIKKWTDGKKIIKIIFVKGKLINIVIK